MSHEATGDTAVEAGFGDVLSETYLEELKLSLLENYLQIVVHQVDDTQLFCTMQFFSQAFLHC